MPIFAVFNIPLEEGAFACKIADTAEERKLLTYADIDELVGDAIVECTSRDLSTPWSPSRDWIEVTARTEADAIDIDAHNNATMPHTAHPNKDKLDAEMAGEPEKPVGLMSLRRVLGLGYAA